MKNILLPAVIRLFVVVTLRTVFNIELCTPRDKEPGEMQLHIQEVFLLFFFFPFRLINTVPPAGAVPGEQFQGVSCQEHTLMEAV